MNKMRARAQSAVATLAVAAVLLGCNSGPSDADISTAVSEVALKSKGLNPLTGKGSSDCGVMHGKITEVTKVEVTERGAHNEKDGYWPAKLKLSGRCEAQKPNCGDSKNQPCPPEPATFEGVDIEVRLKKDDYGNWSVASVVGGDASAPNPNAHTAPSGVEPPSLSIDPKAVTEVAITSKGGDTVTLKKTGDTWKAGDADANQKNVATLVEHLGKLKPTAVVAKAETDVLAKYELDDEHSVHVVVRGGGKALADLKFGKTGSRGTMAVIDGQVVTVSGYSAAVFDRAAAKWRDNTVITFDPDGVSKVVIENSNGKFTFEKTGDAWTSTVPGFDPSGIETMLKAMKTLKATGFADPNADTGLDDAKKTGGMVTITVGDVEHVLKVGNVESGTNRYVQRDGHDTVYVVTAWAADWATADTKKFAK